jgi:pyridoxal 5'-phosphate synthase glutaminase subunit Pdx2
MTIGVLALQGDFAEHMATLTRIGVDTREVRKAGDLEGVDALIIPGGESTTIGKLMARYGLDEAIRARAEQGMPIYGTCAGLILLAKEIEGSRQPRLGLMDIAVIRNAFGRQIESFEADIPFAPTPRPAHTRGVYPRPNRLARRRRRTGAKHLRRQNRRRAARQLAGDRLPSRTDRRHARPPLLPDAGQIAGILSAEVHG